MNGFFGAAFWFVVVLGVLVTFHEFGHFWVARRFGVRVLRFSVGFGRPLWSRVAKDGTQYQVAMVPLGGYVLFLDEREQEVAPAERESAFNRKPAWQRILVVLAGPMANFVLCIALFWAALQLGVPVLSPVLGETRGVAAQAGLVPGDRLLAIGGETVATWQAAITPIALAAIDRKPVQLSVQDLGGHVREATLRLDRLPADFDQTDPLGAIGMQTQLSYDLPVVGLVVPGSAAEGRLQVDDRIRRVGGQEIARFTQIRTVLARVSPHGEPVQVEYERAGRLATVSIAPHLDHSQGTSAYLLGIGNSVKPTIQKYGPADALRMSFTEARKQTGEMLGFIRRLVMGKASSKNISGVIGIAQAANSQAQLGLSSLVWFMGALSLVLCVMNLLPIPVLDGGHLLYYLIELVSGRPVGERTLLAGQYAGLMLLAGLIGLAFYNDLVRNLS
jgi:regulator of sigma E protease